MPNGSSVGICTHCIHVFARLALTCMLSRCLPTKFLHRSSVGTLSRVRCWLGGVNWLGRSNISTMYCACSVLADVPNMRSLSFLLLLLAAVAAADNCNEVGSCINELGKYGKGGPKTVRQELWPQPHQKKKIAHFRSK